MKSVFIFLLSIGTVTLAYAGGSHETVCGGSAIIAAEALLRVNNKNIDSVSQDAQSMKLVTSKYANEGSYEQWDVLLNVKEKGTTSVYRSTALRVLTEITFGDNYSVYCDVREIKMPYAD